MPLGRLISILAIGITVALSYNLGAASALGLFPYDPITPGLAINAQQSQATESPAQSEKRNQGIELYRQGKFVEARKLLESAVKEDKADHEAWYYLGLTLLNEPDKIKNAGKAFESAIKLRPLFADARNGLAFTFLIRNKSADALREAKASLRIEPNNADPYYIISVLSLREGETQGALQNAQAAIDHNPRLAAAYLVKSQALAGGAGTTMPKDEILAIAARSDRYTQAAEALQKYLQLNPFAENIWTEQLESLRIYSSSPLKTASGERVFSSKDLTTKARILKKPEPEYPRSALVNRISGLVILRGILASDGTVKHILIVRGASNGIAEAAVASAKQIKFTPATIDSRPVSMIVQLEYMFSTF